MFIELHLLHLLHSMNTEYRYKLEKSSKKHHCPDCSKKAFVLYIDTTTGDYLPEKYGRCDRESKCAYHLNPYSDGYAKAIQEQGDRSEIPNNWKAQRKKAIPKTTAENVFFDFDTFKQTLQPDRYEQNVFIQNLVNRVQYPFEVVEVSKVIELYRLGTIAKGYRAGANTFPFIDVQGNVRAVQVKQFDEQNHTTGTDFLHSIIEKHHTRNNESLPEWLAAYTAQEKRVSCLFGEHLLSKYHSNPVALVEAPKTAIYGTLYFGLPETNESLIWLAVYNKSSFSFEKLKALQGRFVYVFPDLSKEGCTFKEWETKAKEHESRLPGTRFVFSDLLETFATPEQKEQGADIADILIQLDWRQFRKHTPPQPDPVKGEASEASEAPKTKIFLQVEPLPKVEVAEPEPIQPPENWSNDIAELENYFTTSTLPTHPVILDKGSTILNCSVFIQSHLATVKANNGKRSFLPYLNRLQQLKTILTP